MEADALSMDLNRIAVDDRGSPHDVGEAGAREHYRECNDERTRQHANFQPSS